MKTPRFWQSNNLASMALLPASLLYRIGAWADRRFTTPQRASIPVIAIGNATAGGAGKTPTVLALVPLLRSIGHTPHILTRGYQGAALTAHRVSDNDSWQQVGDEALLLAKAAPTWVGRNRFASAQAAANAGATILLCDDALQHHKLHKDISLLVLDGPFGIGNGQLLPAGPLRETLRSAASRCNAAIIIGDDAQKLATQLSIPVWNAALKPVGDAAMLTGKRVLAFAGIGRPGKFFATLRGLGAEIAASFSFADHHAYTTTDIETLLAEATKLNATLITTSKDAVKIPASFASKILVLPVELELENQSGFKEFLAEMLAALQAS